MPTVALEISDELLEFAAWAAEQRGISSVERFLAKTLERALREAIEDAALRPHEEAESVFELDEGGAVRLRQD